MKYLYSLLLLLFGCDYKGEYDRQCMYKESVLKESYKWTMEGYTPFLKSFSDNDIEKRLIAEGCGRFVDGKHINDVTTWKE